MNRQAALHNERRHARRHKHGKHHRKHRKRRRGSIHVYYYGLYPSYRPYYYGAGYPDPYYYEPDYGYDYVEPHDEKLSCKEAREILYDYGYTRVRSYDCRGTVYGFYVRNRGRSYKVRISADTADVLSKKRI